MERRNASNTCNVCRMGYIRMLKDDRSLVATIERASKLAEMRREEARLAISLQPRSVRVKYMHEA